MDIFEKRNQLAEVYAEWYNYRNRLYPDFVTSSRADSVPEYIPVFSFHNVTNEDLLLKLNYLMQNGYSTINSDEYAYLNGKCNGERLVMLTFDDGLVSLCNVVSPLLRAYQMCAVAFVLPGEIDQEEANGLVEPGKEGDGRLLCSWRELEGMKDVIDIQSHSMYHWLIFESSNVSSYFTPQIKRKFQKIDWPIPRRNGMDYPERDIGFGAPIYKSNSRLSGSLRMYENEKITDAMTSYVEKMGGADFFGAAGWEKALKSEHARLAYDAKFETETPDQRLASITHCINGSKQLLEKKLEKEVKGFCFPFGIGSPETEAIAQNGGYSLVYYGVRPNFNTGEAAEFKTLRRVTRLKDDYLFRLPGENRKSLMKIFYEKAERRIANLLYDKGNIR
ncbi:MAG: polysaccharide deacetylase family protein [Nitrospinota bacterium]|nr:polysaccharide deacetylase family protein [Nitrospinota bacterium]